MDLKSKCPQCDNIQIIIIVPSNVNNTFDLNKARCDSCGYKYGDDWKDLVWSRLVLFM
jgi:DNA polymerase III alpha subunit (gram-positive type)